MNGPFSPSPTMTDQMTPDIDGLLREFYRHEMPNPWPAPPRAAEYQQSVPFQPPRRRQWWDQSRRHLCLAATVTALFLGYWALARSFPNSVPTPTNGASSPFVPAADDIGHRPKVNGVDQNNGFEFNRNNKETDGPASRREDPLFGDPAGAQIRIEQRNPDNSIFIRVEGR